MGRNRILIIDDEMILRNGIKYLCNWEEHGFTIVGEASNGMEGLRLIQQLHPEIVITDIIMPVMDGIELTQKIKELYLEIKVIILSSYDNFDYVKSLFKLGVADYLLKPTLQKEELLNLLNRLELDSHPAQKSSTRELFQQLLQNACFSHEDCLKKLEHRGTLFSMDIPFFLLTGQFRNQQTIFHTAQIPHSLIAEYFSDFPSLAGISDQGRLCILLQSDTQGALQLADRINGFSLALSKQLNQSVLFGISEKFNDLTKLPSAYAGCERLLEYAFYFPEKQLLTESDLSCQSCEFPQDAFIKTLDPLRLQDTRFVLLQFLNQAVRYPSIEVFSLKKQLGGTLYNLIQVLSAAGFDMDGINREKVKYFKNIDSAATSSQLEQVLGQIFDILDAVVETGAEKQARDLFRQIQDYIVENCHEDLKLSEIARCFHLNYTYLSTVFYQSTNEHFSDFLNRVRIEKSRHLLQTEKSTIQKISASCGFVNQGYFAKIFKKTVGMSPKEYQRIYQRNIR